MEKNTIKINGREIPFENERNLLEVIRKANIDLPTFCYHSELSVYGACRLCIVDIEGRGIMSSCSVKPEAGMSVKTHTGELRNIRKISIELLLANHEQRCTTCFKSASCKLQELAHRLGVEKVRFKPKDVELPMDFSSDALVRDPNKCILCGDCVRACDEIQGIGAIDFAYRGSDAAVLPAFGKELSGVECVDCGQCARVCPTGAITPKRDIDRVYEEIDDDTQIVVAQIAPAVRVAIGELFGMEAGTVLTGQIVAALRALGFDKVYDTSYAADLTVLEEAEEFLNRKMKNESLPLVTSCCPGWVKYAEQYYPEMLSNLSTCRSPQQMFGSLAKELLPGQLKCNKENVKVVSIMPCTAKKSEANRPEFEKDGIKDVDYVLTTQELAAMIKRAGIMFGELSPESLDLPFGFKTGAGIIFGSTGGVSEAVLRYASEKVNGTRLENPEFHEVRGMEGLRTTEVNLGGTPVKIGIVHGLANAKALIKKVKSGEADLDFIEVMACPGGCAGGAGQPVNFDPETTKKRIKGIYSADKMVQLHKSQENPYLKDLYQNVLGEPGSEKAHHLLHTNYVNRKRIFDSEIDILRGSDKPKMNIKVCVGTSCYVKDSQDLIRNIISYAGDKGLAKYINVKATFCMEQCEEGPNAIIGEDMIHKADFKKVRGIIDTEFEKILNTEEELLDN